MRHKRPDRINVVFKFYHFYDIKIDGRRVTDVKAQLICELPSFNRYYDTAKLVEICKRENLPVYDSNNEYAVIIMKDPQCPLKRLCIIKKMAAIQNLFSILRNGIKE